MITFFAINAYPLLYDFKNKAVLKTLKKKAHHNKNNQSTKTFLQTLEDSEHPSIPFARSEISAAEVSSSGDSMMFITLLLSRSFLPTVP